MSLSENESNILHEKQGFTLLGFSMLESLLKEMHFETEEIKKIKHLSYIFHTSDLSEKWCFPILGDIKNKLQSLYGVTIKEIEVNLFTDCDIHVYNEPDYRSMFLISVGDSRKFYINETEYNLDDGDMLYVQNMYENKSNFMNSFIDRANDSDKSSRTFHIFFYM